MIPAIFGHVTSALINSSVTPLFYKQIIDITSTATSPEVVSSKLITIALTLAAALTLSNVFLRRMGSYATMTFESNVMRDLADASFDRLRQYSYTFFSNEFAGALVAKQGRFVNSFESIFDFILFTIILGGINLIASITILATIKPSLAAIFAGWVAIYIGVVLILMPYQRNKNLARAAANSKLTALFADTFSNILTVSSFAGSARENIRYGAQSADTAHLRLESWYGQNTSFFIQSVLSVLLQGGVMLVAVIMWSHGQITAGTIVLLQIYVVRAVDMVWDIGRSSIRFQSAINDAQEMADILDKEIDVKDPETPEVSRIQEGAITFHDVTFAYGEREAIFDHLNLNIAPGEKVALVGHSGAGKTTVTKLLLRFLDVTGGAIEIDGQDIRAITQDDLRRSIGYVAQEPMLFHRTLRENISYGKPDATLEEIEEAARKAHAHEFIDKLPLKYDTLVGERGVKLSGGERQRVAIARAMLKNAPILVLDEATSALDSHSEALIQEALVEAMRGRTTIAIAHRLSTIKHMDRILVFEGGKVVEEGSHDTLIVQGGPGRSGIYASLWSQQSGGFIADEDETTSS